MQSRRLRVLFLASYFPKPDNPLMGTWALTQAQALARQDIELLVVSFTSWVPKQIATTRGAKAYAHCPKEFIWTGGVRVRYPRWLYYPVPPVKGWAYINPEPYLKMAWWSVRQDFIHLMEDFQPDVIFCHHALPNGWMLTQLPPTLQKPFITLDHDFDEIADCHRLTRRKAAMQRVSEQAWAMLAVSNRMEKDLRQLFPHARIQTQHNGVDRLPEQLFHQKRPFNLEGKKVILCCALFAKRKGVPLLIEAFSQIAQQHPDAVLRIIGSGPEEAVIQATVDRLDCAQQVQLVGRKPHAEVLQEMVWADCFALVGWDEPFATVYLEAMAAGTPVICCSDGGITDVLQDGIHGYTVPPKDIQATANALDRILLCSSERQEMGHNAQRLILEKLTWDVKAKELAELLEQAVDQPQFVTAV
jgi:glycosyltransferase involved in cell wall biosynthesis